MQTLWQDIRDEPYTVIGVMPEGFQFGPSYIRLWMPIAFTPQTAHRSQKSLPDRCWTFEARRAAKVDPMIALHCE